MEAADIFVSALARGRGGCGLLARLDEVLDHGSSHHGLWRRSCAVIGEAFQVLNGSGQQEFVVSAGQAPQSEPDHGEDVLGLAKQPLDLFAFNPGGGVSLGFHQRLGIVTGFLVDVP